MRIGMIKATCTSVCIAALTACGGGGGSSEPPVNKNNFPINAAMTSVVKSGLQKSLALTGTATNNGTTAAITGSMTITIGATSNSTFEGASAFLSKSTVNGSLTLNGQTSPLTSETLNYLTPSYEITGMTYVGAYCVATTKGVYPATITVGQAGPMGKYNCYTNSNKTTLVGTRVVDYGTTPSDTADKVQFQVSESYYDATGKLSSREGATYTITTTGVATITRYFVQGSNNGTSFEVTGQ